MLTNRCRFGIFTAALTATTTLFLGQTARAQTFTIELVPLPPKVAGAKIKDISNDRSLIVQGLDSQNQEIDNFYYGVPLANGTYPTPLSLFWSGLNPGGLDRRGGFMLGSINNRASAVNVSTNAVTENHPVNHHSSFLQAGDDRNCVGWTRPQGGTRHATIWYSFPGLYSDQQPFIAQQLGADWISSELRGVRSLPGDTVHAVGFGERRDMPGHRAIARLGQWVELHPSSFAESEALTVFSKFQAGWGRDAMGLEHALVWQGNASSALSLNPVGYGNSRALDMDSEGVAGYAKLANVDRASFWKQTPLQASGFGHIDLSAFLPTGSGNSVATGITNGGVIAGQYQVNNLWRPVLWHPIHLTSLTLSGTHTLGGAPTTATVRISRPAPAGGVVVKVGPQYGVLIRTSVPTVTIPAGQTFTTFTVYTRSVSGPTVVSISATLGFEQQVASITLDTLHLQFP
jgi:hypothetical protein